MKPERRPSGACMPRIIREYRPQTAEERERLGRILAGMLARRQGRAAAWPSEPGAAAAPVPAEVAHDTAGQSASEPGQPDARAGEPRRPAG